MYREIRRIGLTLAASLVLVLYPSSMIAQEPVSDQVVAKTGELPEAPQPQIEVAAAVPNGVQAPGGQSQEAQKPAAGSTPAQDSSSSQTPAQQPADEKSQREKAEEQLKQQEHQRVMGVMATFNTTRNKDALPLSPGQKFQLFFKSSTDPWPFFLAGVVAGIGQSEDSYSEWGQGAQGYAKRFGAAYSDAFIGNFFGNAVLPSLMHEDPRYFQKGTGSAISRVLWAASSTVWCKRDRGGWGPNYANVGGNLIGAAIARVYYPASERTVSDTINDGLTVSAEGIVGAEVIEFWPDLARHYRRKHEEKLARQAAQRETQGAAKPAPQSDPAAK
ncbi:MAG: hypothetical protein WAM85_03165 [Terracidiphilus sp.]